MKINKAKIDYLIKKLDEYRLENRLSYKKLAEQINPGIKPGTVYKWISGGAQRLRDINIYHIEKFLKQKGVIK